MANLPPEIIQMIFAYLYEKQQYSILGGLYYPLPPIILSGYWYFPIHPYQYTFWSKIIPKYGMKFTYEITPPTVLFSPIITQILLIELRTPTPNYVLIPVFPSSDSCTVIYHRPILVYLQRISI